MKVLFNTSNFPKWKNEATTPFIYDLAKSIKNRNVNVIILGPHAKKAKKKEIWESIKIYRFQYAWPSFFQKIFAGGGAAINLRKNKLLYLLIPSFIFFQIINLIIIARKEKVKIIHSHWLIPQGLSGLIASKFLNIPHVVSIHGTDIFAFNNFFLTIIKKIVAKYSDHLICNSPLTYKALIKLKKIDKKKTSIIPVPINNIYYRNSIKSGFPKKTLKSESINILFVGRIVEEKGLEIIIKAYSTYLKNINSTNNCTLIVAGEGKDKQKFLDLTKELKIEQNVVFTGWKNQKDLQALYKKANIFVGISLRSKEGGREALGISFIEAMTQGCQIITGEGTGFLSFLNNKKKINGLYILEKPYNEKSLSNLFKLLSKKNSNRKELIKNNEDFISNFSSVKIGNHIRKIYSLVLVLKKNDEKPN